MSEPRNSVIGSNVPSDLVLPKRFSTRPVVPPTAVPGPKWQVWHDASLKTGPSPSSTASTAANSSLPAVNSASWSAVRLRNGSPNAAVIPTRGATSVPGSGGLVTPEAGGAHAASHTTAIAASATEPDPRGKDAVGMRPRRGLQPPSHQPRAT